MNTKLLKDKAAAFFAVIAVAAQRVATSRPAKAARKWCWRHRGELIRHAVVVAIAVTLCIVISNRARPPKAEAKDLEPAATENAEVTPAPTPAVNQQYRAEAELIAKVCYGIRDNSEQDIRTYIWCIFNRVDNPAREFGNTLTEVISKKSQWLFYDHDNPGPVLESLYQIAYEEVQRWHEDHRPCACDFVYAEWSSDSIVLRNTWEYNKYTETWGYGT